MPRAIKNKQRGYTSNPKLPIIAILKIFMKLNANNKKSTEKTETKVIPLFNLVLLILSSLVFVGYTAKVPPG